MKKAQVDRAIIAPAQCRGGIRKHFHFHCKQQKDGTWAHETIIPAGSAIGRKGRASAAWAVLTGRAVSVAVG